MALIASFMDDPLDIDSMSGDVANQLSANQPAILQTDLLSCTVKCNQKPSAPQTQTAYVIVNDHSTCYLGKN